MTTLFYYNPISTTRLADTPDGQNWKKLYNWISLAVGLVDRTDSLQLPVNTKAYAGCGLPVLANTTMTYKDCCDRRATELMALSEQLQKPLGLMWSGGIDSTRLMVAFLENFPLSVLKERVRVIISQDSVIENPEFYRNYILPNFEFINSEYTPWLFNKEIILVTGELNDQLMGSDTMKGYRFSNADKFNQPYNKAHIMEYCNGLIKDPVVTELIVDAVANSATHYGLPIEYNCDWFWWYNFCFKWQGVWFRLLVISTPALWQNINSNFAGTYLHHFFSTDYFQLWSIHNRPYRSMQSWTNYKQVAKQEIFNFDGNQDYFDTKIKKGSLYTVFSQRTMFDAIDSDWNPIHKIQDVDWYNPENDFK